MRFTLKRGDTQPSLRAQLLDVRKRPVVLDPADVVLFFMENRDRAEGEIAGGTTNVVEAATGTVEYRWQTGDTDIAGVYDAEFRVAFFGGGQESFPNGEYINVVILPDVAANLATPP